MTTDEELIEAIATGNHAAFTTLVNRHAVRFYRIAFRILHNKEDAEDMVQDSFIKLWKQPGLWQNGKSAKFTTWFYRIIVNQCLDVLKRKPVELLEDYEELIDSTPSEEVQIDIRRQEIWLENAIRSLPESQQTALNLCFYEGISNQEAAEVMGVSLKALQSLLMRAKQSLKEKLRFTMSHEQRHERKHL